MLESIARNIATAIFIVCALIVGSLFPEKEEPEPTPTVAIETETKETS